MGAGGEGSLMHRTLGAIAGFLYRRSQASLMNNLLTLNETAGRLNITPDQVRGLIDDGKLNTSTSGEARSNQDIALTQPTSRTSSMHIERVRSHHVGFQIEKVCAVLLVRFPDRRASVSRLDAMHGSQGS